MKPLTYFGFTILSVFIQFCVMEFIHEKYQLDKDSTRLNETTLKTNDALQRIYRRPHALFYRTGPDQTFDVNTNAQSAKYSNSSLEDTTISSSTDILSTTFDLLYDENTSVSDDFFTTESYFTSSEYDNVTEITLLEKGSSTAKPSFNKKATSKNKCYCNLLYKKCDINCCCDDDCTEEEQRLFMKCIDNGCQNSEKNKLYPCNNKPICGHHISIDAFNDLLCVVKVNLPDKRIKSYYKLDETSINSTYKWSYINKPDALQNYKKKKYEYGDPLWLIQNESIIPMYLPTTVANNYCSGTKPIKFLVNERIKCNVKKQDLYVSAALKTLEKTKLISVTDLSLNNSIMNCSSLHCTNWTVLACDNVSCGDFNKTIHAPKCTESNCNNLALKLEYNFYYSDSRITNASLRLQMSKINFSKSLMFQEISVKWYLGNKSINDIIQLSGNPGYSSGLPVIASSAYHNRTNNFFNVTHSGENFIQFPHNENGKCVWSNTSNNMLLFGVNARSKCRLHIQQIVSPKNASSTCRGIQTNIKQYLRLHQKLFISPYGNPTDVSDDTWVLLEVFDQTFVYGEFHTKNTKLNCYNMVTRYAFDIAFAAMSDSANEDGNQIVKAAVHVTPYNITFDAAVLTTILTIDVRFVDISRPINEFASAPHLSLHLPANFFFDYPSNKCSSARYNITLICLTSLVLLIQQIK